MTNRESARNPGNTNLSPDGFYVVGGRQRPPRLGRPEWELYGQAAIVHVSPRTGSVNPVAEYVSRVDACAWNSEPSILFKASTKVGDRLYACTSTEVVVYSLPSFEQLNYISHPYFNDLHHVTVNENGELVIVNTGLDMVMVMSAEGDLLAEYSVSDERPWTRFSKDIDYRKVQSTKPHKSHPNFAFSLDCELWVTRLEEKDAVSITKPGERIEIKISYPHDGLVRGGGIYFTTVDGHILVFDAKSKALRRAVDLNPITGRDKALGWCRGLEVLGPDQVVVGFTKLRRTKFHEKLIWVKEQFRGELLLSEATRIAAYDLKKEELLWEVELDFEAYGLNTIFAIHNATD